MQAAGYAGTSPEAPLEPPPVAEPIDVNEYMSFADLSKETDGLVLAANKPVDIVLTPAAVTLAEKGFAKGSNPAKMIVTQGLTLNQIAALGRKPSMELKDESGTV